MTKDDVLNKLRAGNILIEFVKVGGARRLMRATLSENIIIFDKKVEGSSTTRKVSEHTCSVWDVEANAWKSFRWDSLRLVDGINLPNGIK